MTQTLFIIGAIIAAVAFAVMLLQANTFRAGVVLAITGFGGIATAFLALYLRHLGW